MSDITLNLLLAYGVYLMGVLSPGPSNIVIMQHSLWYGRKGGLATSLGVSTGSLIWGIVSAFGLGALIWQYPALLHVLGLLGGGYFLWLSVRSFLAMRVHHSPHVETEAQKESSVHIKRLYFYGVAAHLTNPKAFIVWVSIVTLGSLGDSVSWHLPFLVVLGCGMMGFVLFNLMAIVFSTKPMMQAYLRYGVVINGLLALMFLLASLSLLYRSFVGFSGG